MRPVVGITGRPSSPFVENGENKNAFFPPTRLGPSCTSARARIIYSPEAPELFVGKYVRLEILCRRVRITFSDAAVVTLNGIPSRFRLEKLLFRGVRRVRLHSARIYAHVRKIRV